MKQYIATENYPDNYKRNQNCSFNFNAPAGSRIVVFFEDFHLIIYKLYTDDFLHFHKFNFIDTHTHADRMQTETQISAVLQLHQ